jgi:hypothetical protein
LHRPVELARVCGKFTGLTQDGIFHHASEVISCGMAASSGSSPYASMISNHSFRRDAGSGLPHQGQCLISTKRKSAFRQLRVMFPITPFPVNV